MELIGYTNEDLRLVYQNKNLSLSALLELYAITINQGNLQVIVT